jgi:hypothetical protein
MLLVAVLLLHPQVSIGNTQKSYVHVHAITILLNHLYSYHSNQSEAKDGTSHESTASTYSGLLQFPIFLSNCLIILFTGMFIVITFVSNKHFRLVGIYQRRLEENTSRQEAFSNVANQSQCHSSSASSI